MKRDKPHTWIAAIFVLLLTMGGMAGPVWAISPDEMLPNPALEARARAIGKELRCLVCQNESIDESNADLAHDLRLLVRQRILAGDTDEQVKQYMVARYGTYVLLKPPFNPQTMLLWLGPMALLLCAIGAAAIFYRRSLLDATGPVQFSDDEKRRLTALVGDDPTQTKGP